MATVMATAMVVAMVMATVVAMALVAMALVVMVVVATVTVTEIETEMVTVMGETLHLNCWRSWNITGTTFTSLTLGSCWMAYLRDTSSHWFIRQSLRMARVSRRLE